MIATQESSLKLHQERWQQRDKDQEVTITRLKEEAATLRMQVQEREKGQSEQESAVSRLKEEVASLRIQVQEEKDREPIRAGAGTYGGH